MRGNARNKRIFSNKLLLYSRMEICVEYFLYLCFCILTSYKDVFFCNRESLYFIPFSLLSSTRIARHLFCKIYTIVCVKASNGTLCFTYILSCVHRYGINSKTPILKTMLYFIFIIPETGYDTSNVRK